MARSADDAREACTHWVLIAHLVWAHAGYVRGPDTRLVELTCEGDKNKIWSVRDLTLLPKKVPRPEADAGISEDCAWAKFTAEFFDTEQAVYVRLTAFLAAFNKKLRKVVEEDLELDLKQLVQRCVRRVPFVVTLS